MLIPMTAEVLPLSPLRRRQVTVARCAASLLLLGSAFAAAYIPVPPAVPAVALKSEWVFRGMVFVAFPVGVAVVWSIIASVLDGRPLQKLGFGPFSIERHIEAATTALAAGGTALQTAERALPTAADDAEYKAAMVQFRASLTDLESLGARP